jgi:predicted porin
MKKHLLALAAFAAVSAPALAQTVTLYGIADVGMATVSNRDGKRWTGQDSGRLQSSRFGLRGSEDLGDGLRANFTFESGLNMTTGASASATVMFNRQAFLGLSSTTWGAVTMGRQYTPIYDHLILQSGAPTFGVAGGAVDGIAPGANAAARFDNTIGGTRIDSAFKYTSPVFSGFKANAMLALDEGGARGQFQSVGLGYASGPLTLGVAYHKSDCLKSAPCSGTKADDELVGLGGGYDFGVARMGVIYTSQKNAKNVRGNNADVFSVLATVPLGLWSLSAGYQTLNDKTALNQDIRQFNLSALYLLSKRTALYSAYTTQKVDNGGKAGMALMNSSTSKQNQLSVGVRHAF